MKLVAAMRAKNESAIIAETIPRLLKQCDAVVVLDNGSTDDTGPHARDLGARVLRYVPHAYHEGLERTILYCLARFAASELAGGDDDLYVLSADADEVWDGDLRAECERATAKSPPHVGAWTFPLYDLRLCDAAPEEHQLSFPLVPNRVWAEPFFRRIPRLFLADESRCLVVWPFREHHTTIPRVEAGCVMHLATPVRHYGLCRSVADFEDKRRRYTTQHRGEAYDAEWRQAKAVIPSNLLRRWEPGTVPPSDAVECHVGSNVAKRDPKDRSRILSEVW